MEIGAPACDLVIADMEPRGDLQHAQVRPSGGLAQLDKFSVLDSKVHRVAIAQRSHQPRRDSVEPGLGHAPARVDGLVVVQCVNTRENSRWRRSELPLLGSNRKLDRAGVEVAVEGTRKPRVLGLDGQARQCRDGEVLHPDGIRRVEVSLFRDRRSHVFVGCSILRSRSNVVRQTSVLV